MKRDKNTNLAAHMKTQKYDVCKVPRLVGGMMLTPSWRACLLAASRPPCVVRLLLPTAPGPRLLLRHQSWPEPSRRTEWDPLRVTSARTPTWSRTGFRQGFKGQAGVLQGCCLPRMALSLPDSRCCLLSGRLQGHSSPDSWLPPSHI